MLGILKGNYCSSKWEQEKVQESWSQSHTRNESTHRALLYFVRLHTTVEVHVTVYTVYYWVFATMTSNYFLLEAITVHV